MRFTDTSEPELRGSVAFFYVDQPLVAIAGSFELLPKAKRIETPSGVWLRSDLPAIRRLLKRAAGRKGTCAPKWAEKIIGDTRYELTPAFCEGAMDFFASYPYSNPYDEDTDEARHGQWEDGNACASAGEVKKAEIKAALKKIDKLVGRPSSR